MPTDTSAEPPALRLLTDSALEVEGRLTEASNVALRVWVADDALRIPAIYKPIRGERPLWDFPEGSLAGRELAAWMVSEATGWGFVPQTVLRDGPLGPGTVQQWVGALDGDHVPDYVRIDEPDSVPRGNIAVLHVEDERGRPLVVSHGDTPWLRRLALFDAVVNNADRKASALLEDGEQVWAIDHGLCFHPEDKLRTVFWGFADDPIAADDLATLRALRSDVDGDLGQRLRTVLAEDELAALQERITALLESGHMPAVPDHRHPLPWPLW